MRWITVEKHRPGALLAIGPYGGESWQVLQWRLYQPVPDASVERSAMGGYWREWIDCELFPEAKENSPV